MLVRQTSKWGQILLLSLVGLGATAFTTSWFYRLDEVVTVQGRLVPQFGGVEIKSSLTGQISEIRVKNGQVVTKGQILIAFDVENARSTASTLDEQLAIERIRLEQSLNSTDQRIETLKRNIKLTGEILNRLRPLQVSGAISELQILQQENSLLSQQDEMLQLVNRRNQILNESASRKADLKEKIAQVKFQLKNEFITAPISGTVFDLKPDSVKYVTQQAEPLLKIVPRGNLSGIVNITNKDIGFINAGQKVKVRIDSFPYTEYGDIPGTISRVGADALPPTPLISQYHFPVFIDLSRSHLTTKNNTSIPLQAGMTITANLKLRDRRLIELLGELFTDKSEGLKRLRQN